VGQGKCKCKLYNNSFSINLNTILFLLQKQAHGGGGGAVLLRPPRHAPPIPPLEPAAGSNLINSKQLHIYSNFLLFLSIGHTLPSFHGELHLKLRLH